MRVFGLSNLGTLAPALTGVIFKWYSRHLQNCAWRGLLSLCMWQEQAH